jgi:flagellar biosynthesis protein FlhF
MAQRFHTFRAPSLDAAYAQMRRVLGGDAVIVRTTQVREGGIWGLLGRTVVEVTASAPDPLPQSVRQMSLGERKYAEQASVGSDTRISETVAYFRKVVEDAQERMALKPVAMEAQERVALKPVAAETQEPMPEEAGVTFRTPKSAVQSDTNLRHEVQEIREMLQVLVAETPSVGLPAEFAPHYRLLVERGVSRRAAAALVSAVAKAGDKAVLRDPSVFVERLKMEIRKVVPVTGGISLSPDRRKVVAMIGATGVGKTTNVAKLAAHFAVRERARVALVTADTYRVAAPEQLRVYANIIGLPMEIVSEPSEMEAALKRLTNYDLVLIDTAGGSQFNARQIHELSRMLQAAHPDEVMLLMSANTQLEDLRQVVHNFRAVRPSTLFFSKLDETQRYGVFLSLLAEVALPLSYFSIGQNVPDDIMLARPATVARLILEGRNGRGSRSSAKSA